MFSTRNELSGLCNLLMTEYSLAANIPGGLILDESNAIREKELGGILQSAWTAAKLPGELTKVTRIQDAIEGGNFILFLNKDDSSFFLHDLGKLMESGSAARGIIVVADQGNLKDHGLDDGGRQSLNAWLDQIWSAEAAEANLKQLRQRFILEDSVPLRDDGGRHTVDNPRLSSARALLVKHNLLPIAGNMSELEVDIGPAAAEWWAVMHDARPKFLWIAVVHDERPTEPDVVSESSSKGLAICIAELALDMSRVRREHPAPGVSLTYPGFAIQVNAEAFPSSFSRRFTVVPDSVAS